MTLKYEDAIENAMEIVRRSGRNPRLVSSAVRTVFLIANTEFEIANGGVLQWFANSSGRYSADTARAFEELGARECAAVLRRALAFFPGGVPAEDDDARQAQIGHLLPVAAATWRECGNALLEWPDDIDKLLRHLVSANENEFILADAIPN